MKPNLLIIYTDQHSKDFISCYADSLVKTPNIDAIAQKGVKFNNFFTPSAVCTPSRGCLLTGRYPHQNGAYRNDEKLYKNERTFAHNLSDSGYKTAYIGKWHLAGDIFPGWGNEINPMGFEDHRFMFNGRHHKKVIEVEGDNPELSYEIGDEKTYMTDWLADKSVAFINEEKDPFCLFVGIPDPHQPFKVREPYASMYKPEDMVIPESFYQEKLPDWADQDEWGRKHYFPIEEKGREERLRTIMAQYCGEVKCIDDNVGKILKALSDNNILENTIIIYTTDHGEYMGQHGLLEKNNLFDSVYNVPFILSWQGNKEISQGSEVNTFVNVVDFKQTILSLMDVKVTGNEQGVDASGLLKGEKVKMIDEAYIHPNDVPRTGIITPEYELAYVDHGWIKEDYSMFKDHILFDRVNDKNQLKNLFLDQKYQGVIETLKEKIIKHHETIGTPNEVLPKAIRN